MDKISWILCCGLTPNVDELKIAFIVCFSNFIVFFCDGIPAPFLPGILQENGMLDIEIGISFGALDIVRAIISPIVGIFLYKFGCKKSLIFGYIILIIPVGCMSLLSILEGSSYYAAVCIILRTLQGFGGAIIDTVSFSLLLNEIPLENVGQYFAVSEIWVGLGASLGPPVGGFFYEYTGFVWTFVFATILLFLPIPVIFFRYTDPSSLLEEEEDQVPFLKVLGVPWVWLIAVACIISVNNFGVLNSTLELHLLEFNLTPFVVGLIFLVPAVVYMVCGLLIPPLTNKIGGGKPIILIGLLIQAISFLFIGPVPFIYLKNQIWTNIFALFLLGIGTAFSIIPNLEVLHNETSHLGNTSNIISGIISALFSFGAGIGPIVGSGITQIIGFKWMTTVIFLLCGVSVFVYFFKAFLEFLVYVRESRAAINLN